nr:hypothetical protein [Deltaproteobacteria bacterium]
MNSCKTDRRVWNIVGLFFACGFISTSDFNAHASDWDQVVAAAKKEGQVVVAQGGGSGADLRRLMTDRFEKEYPGIRVDITVAGGRSIAPRILMERRVGKYLWDVY